MFTIYRNAKLAVAVKRWWGWHYSTEDGMTAVQAGFLVVEWEHGYEIRRIKQATPVATASASCARKGCGKAARSKSPQDK